MEKKYGARTASSCIFVFKMFRITECSLAHVFSHQKKIYAQPCQSSTSLTFRAKVSADSGASIPGSRMNSWRAWKLIQEVRKMRFGNAALQIAVQMQLGQRWLAGCIVSSRLKSHSHPATQQWGGKPRKDQARGLDQSWSRAGFNTAPLACPLSVQTGFRWSSLGRQWGEQPFNTANNFIFYRNCARDGGRQQWQYLRAFGEKQQHRPELGYGKQQGSKSKAKQEELCWEFPQICWFFPRIMGHAPSVGI